MQIKLSASYFRALKKFVSNNKKNSESVKKALKLFKENPNHPSLNLEKLQHTEGVYTIRVNKGDRLFLIRTDKDTVILIDVGKHDKYRKY